jgi:dTDP-4-amino-4,6-dideoxygalactose transaminase
MIPRRRILLEAADLVDWLRAPWATARAAAEVATFEREFAEAMQVPHAYAVSSGRDALCLIIDALHPSLVMKSSCRPIL